MQMDNKSLTESFGDSLESEAVDIIEDFTELSLDSIMNEGIIKDIPFISTVISLYKIGTNIRECHNIKKIAIFLKKINENTSSKEKRDMYINKFKENAKFREKELEYILVLIERYITYDQPEKLAKLYLSYIYKDITWQDFLQYSVIIDRLIPGDYDFLYERENDKVHYYPSSIDGEHVISFVPQPDSYLRLIGLGLMWETDDMYKLTKLGDRLLDILGCQQIEHGYIEV